MGKNGADRIRHSKCSSFLSTACVSHVSCTQSTCPFLKCCSLKRLLMKILPQYISWPQNLTKPEAVMAGAKEKKRFFTVIKVYTTVSRKDLCSHNM